MQEYKGLQGGKYFLVETLEDFEVFYARALPQKMFAVDTETSGLAWYAHNACGIVIGWGPENNYYIPIDHKDHFTELRIEEGQLHIEDIIDRLKVLLEDPERIYLFWNAKYDLHILARLGIMIVGLIHDGLTGSFLLDENMDHSLKYLSNKFIDKKANRYEKEINLWRAQEAKRRQSAYNELLKGEAERLKTDFKVFLEASKEAERRLKEFIESGDLDATQIKRKRTYLVRTVLKEKALENVSDPVLEKNKKDQISYDLIPIDIIYPYACADVHYTWVLTLLFLESVVADEDLKKLYLNEMSLLRVLFKMEEHGVKINKSYLEEQNVLMADEMAKLDQELKELAGRELNLNSTAQLTEVLQEQGCVLTKLTKKSKEDYDLGITENLTYAVDKEVLESLAPTNPFVQKVLDYRKLVKVKGTYVEGILERLDANDYIHSTFNPNVRTGRMSSYDPNVQNIDGNDKRVKRAFIVCDDGHVFIFIDYSQVELRLTAHLSQDPILLACYPWQGKGLDVHSLTCSEVVMGIPYDEVLEMKEDYTGHRDDVAKCDCNACTIEKFRRVAKIVNFGIVYGVGPDGLMTQASTPEYPLDRETCAQYIENYLAKYANVDRWIRTTENFVWKHRYVQNVFGRYRRFPDIHLKIDGKYQNKYRSFRQAVNFLVQGTAADLFKLALVRVEKFLRGTGVRLVNAVHDDAQFYWPKSQLHLVPKVKAIMEDFNFSVPLVADVSVSTSDWAAKKPVNNMDELMELAA